MKELNCKPGFLVEEMGVTTSWEKNMTEDRLMDAEKRDTFCL